MTSKEERHLIEAKTRLFDASKQLVDALAILAAGAADWLAELPLPHCPRPHRATRAGILFGPITNQYTGAIVATIITTDQQVHAAVVFTDRRGNPATVEGVPAWDTDSPAILSVTPEPDGMSALIVALGPLGAAQVSVTADADLGTGVRAIAGTADVEVMAAEAVAASLSLGAPEPQP